MKKTMFPFLAAFSGLLLITFFIRTTRVQGSNQDPGHAWNPEQQELLQESGEIQSAQSVNPPSYLSSLRIPGIALQPLRYDYEYFSSQGCLSVGETDHTTSFVAPLYLPDGSTVKYLRWYFSDYNLPDAVGQFLVYDFNGEEIFTLELPSSGSSGSGMSTSEEFTRTINYDVYSYAVGVELPIRSISDGAYMVCGFRIYYKPSPGSLFLPTIFKSDTP